MTDLVDVENSSVWSSNISDTQPNDMVSYWRGRSNELDTILMFLDYYPHDQRDQDGYHDALVDAFKNGDHRLDEA